MQIKGGRTSETKSMIKQEKAEEIADCFIVLMNIAMFSGFSSEELVETISKKIEVVKERIESKQ